MALGADVLLPRVPPPGTATAVIESGDSTERLDMVFLGDGYTADELANFAADVDRMAAYMLSIFVAYLSCAFPLACTRPPPTDCVALCFFPPVGAHPDGTGFGDRS